MTPALATMAGPEPKLDMPETPLLRDASSDIQLVTTTSTTNPALRPETWDDIVGNKRAIERIRDAIFAAKARKEPISHILLFGPPGVGKTTISKMIARDMSGQFFESTASTFTKPQDVIRVVRSMNLAREATGQPSVLFMDEIHMLGTRTVSQETIYPLLEDWVFYHNCIGKTIRGRGPEDAFVVTSSRFEASPFTCIGATTEPGVLSQALQRRFLIQIEMEPYSEDEIAEIVTRACRRMTVPITEGAAMALSRFCRQNPARAFGLLNHARDRMTVLGEAEITDGVIEDTVEREKLSRLGLTATDVRALQFLANRYPGGMGQGELSRALNISITQFSQMMEPYLRQRGFIETLSRRVITVAGLRYLDAIGQADKSRAEIRAVLAKKDS